MTHPLWISSFNIIKRRIMAGKRYPIGIQTFGKIRTEDRLYINKTEYPVLHFCMAMGKHMEKEQQERYLLYKRYSSCHQNQEVVIC